METITIQIGNVLFDIPKQLIENAKPFTIENVIELDKIKSSEG